MMKNQHRYDEIPAWRPFGLLDIIFCSQRDWQLGCLEKSGLYLFDEIYEVFAQCFVFIET